MKRIPNGLLMASLLDCADAVRRWSTVNFTWRGKQPHLKSWQASNPKADFALNSQVTLQFWFSCKHLKKSIVSYIKKTIFKKTEYVTTKKLVNSFDFKWTLPFNWFQTHLEMFAQPKSSKPTGSVASLLIGQPDLNSSSTPSITIRFASFSLRPTFIPPGSCESTCSVSILLWSRQSYITHCWAGSLEQIGVKWPTHSQIIVKWLLTFKGHQSSPSGCAGTHDCIYFNKHGAEYQFSHNVFIHEPVGLGINWFKPTLLQNISF